MESKQLFVSRETLLGLPPKVRNLVSFGSVDDGMQSEIVDVRALSTGGYTYVVFHGMACGKEGVEHVLSLARFHEGSFSLPKMHHTVAFAVPENAKVCAFDVVMETATVAKAMIRLDNKTTLIYPLLLDAVFVDLPSIVRGEVGAGASRESSFLPIAPAPSGAFYGWDASSSTVCQLQKVREQFRRSDASVLPICATEFRLCSGEGLIFFSKNEGGVTFLGNGKKGTTRFRLLPEDENSSIEEVRIFPKAADVTFAVLIRDNDEDRRSVKITAGGEWQSVVLPPGDEPSCISVGQDGCVYVGTSTAAVHKYAVYNGSRPLSTQRFPSWVSPQVRSVVDGPNGRLFVAVDGVLWQTDRDVEAQGLRTAARYAAYVLLVCVLIYLTLFIGM